MSTSPGGWTCGCGTWVPYGQPHSCFMYPQQPQTAQPNLTFTASSTTLIESYLSRIAMALERIAKAFEEARDE